jgi:integrase
MASVSIRTRKTTSGEKRFQVRYRLGGRAYPLVHAGSFETMKEARSRRDFVAGELAANRNPAEALRVLSTPVPTRRTFAECAAAFVSSRVDVSATTARNYGSHLKRILPFFGDRDPATIGAAEVIAWVGENDDLGPASLGRYMMTLRQILDFAEVEPNPARDERVKLPRLEDKVLVPPSGEQVETILAHVPESRRLTLRVLEQTGMRVGELAELEWQDVDVAGSRFRIRRGKTASARRWVAVPSWLMVEIQESCPPDDRVAERRVFPGQSEAALRNLMARACRAAGIPLYSPHDLRHRYASVKVAEGVPVTELAAQLGHAKKSMTLDVYSHVLIDEGRN